MIQRRHFLALAWLVVVLVAALVAWRGKVDTDLFALLPGGDEVFVTRALRGGEQQITLLIRARDPVAVQRAAHAFADALAGSRVIALLRTDPAALLSAVLPYRFQLLSSADRAAIQRGDDGALLTRGLTLLGGPEAIGRLTPTAQDPLGTLERFLRERLTLLSTLTSSDERAVVVQARINGSPFDLAVQSAVTTTLARAAKQMRSVESSAQLLRAGAIFHAAANADAARTQTALVGSIATAVVLLLAFWLFRQLRSVALVMVPVAVGAVVAFGVAFLLFPSLHVITLVFGATLIGLASDYAFHFLVARDGDDAGMVRRLAPTLFSSAVCTALAYGCLALAGMRALTEVALIGAVGLLAAAVTVVLWFPLLCRGLPVRLQALPRIAQWWRSRSEKTGIAVVVLVGVSSGLVLINRGQLIGDARALDGTPPMVRAETAAVLKATGGFDAGAFILLQERDPQALLAAEERLRAPLDRLVREHALGGYLASSVLVPSLASQAADFRRLQSLWSVGGAGEQLTTVIGAQTWAQQWRTQTPAVPLASLEPVRFAGQLNGVWLGAANGTQASVIRLAGISDRAALQRAVRTVHGAQWVSVPARLSSMFEQLALFAAYALALALAVVAAGLAAWQRSARALLGMLPIVVAVLAALAVSCVLNPHLNLFHLFGAFLVLGFGTDSVVVQLTADDENTTLGIIVSQVTTSLDFAALTLIDVPAVRAMGAVVAVGTMLAMLLSIVFRHSYRATAGGGSRDSRGDKR